MRLLLGALVLLAMVAPGAVALEAASSPPPRPSGTEGSGGPAEPEFRLGLAEPSGSVAAPSHPEQVAPSRENVLPPPVANVTQDPWRPERGEDVAVYVTLRDGWAEPRAVLLRYCRVEPEYACWPTSIRMQRVGESSSEWAGVIPWDGRFMKKDTVHVGYNLSLVYDNGTEFEAPTANYNEPAAFPVESGGRYFFYRVSADSRTLDALGGTPFVIAGVFVGAVALARRLRTRRRLQAQHGKDECNGGGLDGST